MVITIGREYGSGGHETGRLLAKRLNLEFYDKVRLIEKTKEDVYKRQVLIYLGCSAESFIFSLRWRMWTIIVLLLLL